MSAPARAPPLRRTALYDFHVAHGAHLTPFAGWEMPLYYDAIGTEHRAVRSAAGLFDVSHMGILTIDGASAADLLARRTTAEVHRLVPGQCRYTFLLDAEGAMIDDLLITRLDDGSTPEQRFLAVPNAATAGPVYDLLRSHRRPSAELALHNPEVAILAVQGPKSRALLEGLFPWDLGALKNYAAGFFPKHGGGGRSLGAVFPAALTTHHLVSRTGYTGELGYEVFVRAEEAPALAERIVAAGATPTGLGARDSLRLEKGFLLSGQDFHRDHTPLEAGQDRFVDFDHVFVGREALEAQRKAGVPVRLSGLSTEVEGAIPRHGTPIWVGDHGVGIVSSGGISFSLGRGIGLAYLPTPLAVAGTTLELELRGRRVPAVVTPTPFYPVRPANP